MLLKYKQENKNYFEIIALSDFKRKAKVEIEDNSELSYMTDPERLAIIQDKGSNGRSLIMSPCGK